jgi:HEAT repeat protein
MRFAMCAGLLIVVAFGLSSSAAQPADVQQLAASLAAPAAATRVAAADALADLGSAAQAAVPQLMSALAGNDAELRWRAARALGVIGSPQAIPALRRQATDPDTMVRSQAIFALGRLHADDQESLAAIVAALSDKEVQVRRACVRALGLIKADRKVTVPLVVKLLEDSDPQVAMRALSAIAEAGAEAVPALSAALNNPQARYWACLALSEMGAQAKDAVPGLRMSLADERPEVRLQATIALAEIGTAARPALPELIKLLGDKFESVRNSAVFALGRIGDKAAAAAVTQADKPADSYLHMLCSWALARMNPDDKQRQKDALDLLASKLGDKDRDAAHMAARAIAELEPTADAIRPVMERTLATADAETADRIFTAFASLGPRILPLAINALKDPSPLRRERSLRVLAKMGPDAAPAAAEVTALIPTGDAKLKTEALYVIGAIGPAASVATAAAAAALGDADPQVQQTAAYALGKIGPAAKEAAPALRRLTAAGDDLVKLTAVWALLQVGPPSDELTNMAVPILSGALTSQREVVRVEAATALGNLGKAAAVALPALEKAQQDPSAHVRSAAANAMKQIKG